MTVEQLQTRVGRNKQSPLFARLAEEYLRSNKIDEAIRLCTEGLQRFPAYTTAHVVAAFCLGKRGEFQGAVGHIDDALRDLPDNTVIAKLQTAWREKLKSVREHNREGERMPEISVSELALGDGPIVSSTLAEIYAAQGAYEAAIAMYGKLQRLKPQQSALFEAKIRELREKLRRQA